MLERLCVTLTKPLSAVRPSKYLGFATFCPYLTIGLALKLNYYSMCLTTRLGFENSLIFTTVINSNDKEKSLLAELNYIKK